MLSCSSISKKGRTARVIQKKIEPNSITHKFSIRHPAMCSWLFRRNHSRARFIYFESSKSQFFLHLPERHINLRPSQFLQKTKWKDVWKSHYEEERNQIAAMELTLIFPLIISLRNLWINWCHISPHSTQSLSFSETIFFINLTWIRITTTRLAHFLITERRARFYQNSKFEAKFQANKDVFAYINKHGLKIQFANRIKYTKKSCRIVFNYYSIIEYF